MTNVTLEEFLAGLERERVRREAARIADRWRERNEIKGYVRESQGRTIKKRMNRYKRTGEWK